MKKITLVLFSLFFLSCQGQKKEAVNFSVNKSDSEWRSELTKEQYEVLRKKGTERAFTGAFFDHFEKGTYQCAACDHVLFDSDTKYDSHCGWPSFDQAIEGAVIYENDYSFGMTRVEVMCAQCGGHLGHIFDDGPQETTGKRFCMNSVSLKFTPDK
jgi:peptide-methionine (R)-S-oxide reductase